MDPTFDDARRLELRAFLRSRRARLRPKDVGLPHGGARRRTAGLRREEVAALAGLSVTWYTLLENGRNDRISADAIAHVARALRLDDDEANYLAALARVAGSVTAPETPAPLEHVRALLDDLGTTPAVVWNRRRDALMWNASFAALFEYAESDAGWERNGVWRIFKDAARTRRWPEWEAAAARAVAGVKREFSREPELVHELVNELRDEPTFARLWETSPSVHDWMTDVDGIVRVVAADGTSLLFRPTTLAPQGAARYLIQFFTPADAATRTVVRTISASRRPSATPETSA